MYVVAGNKHVAKRPGTYRLHADGLGAYRDIFVRKFRDTFYSWHIFAHLRVRFHFRESNVLPREGKLRFYRRPVKRWRGLILDKVRQLYR